MRLTRIRLSLLLLASAPVLAASSCVKERPELQHPPVAYLQAEPEPQLSPDVLTNAAALDEYDIAHESWGRRGWARVGAICAWFRDAGAKLDCPKP